LALNWNVALAVCILNYGNIAVYQSVLRSRLFKLWDQSTDPSVIQDGVGRHLEKSNMEISRQWFDRSPRNLAGWRSAAHV